MKISVVIPARNEEEILPRCLEALQRQRVDDFELIVVDSASADRTGAVARRFGARLIRVAEPGVGLARHIGFSAATGDVILSTDADAVPPPDWIERLTAPFFAPGVVGAYGTILLMQGRWLADFGRSFFPWFQRINHHLGRPMVCGPNFAVRAEAFREVGGFLVDGAYPREAEDVQLALKLRRVGRLVFLPRAAVPVSARRLTGKEGLRYASHHAGNYLRLFWLRNVKG